MAASSSFAMESARYLRDVYLPRLRSAADILPNADLFWRPHPDCISFGTILLHLEGNLRQWILCGLGDHRDQRDRDSEFAATEGPPGRDGEQLLGALEDTVRDAATLLESLDQNALGRRLSIQGYDVSCEEAVYHVVEHFSWHTGQAVWIAKARAGAGHGLGFYDDATLHEAADSEQQTD